MILIGYYNYTVIATYAAAAAALLGVFFAITGRYDAAAICLMVSGGLDMVDGRIARTMKNRTAKEKLFGIQIDSLCDLVGFGVLPAALGYCLGPKSWVWAAVAVVYLLAAVIRLSYFNVDEMDRQAATDGARKHYEGLPVTSAAALFPLMYCVCALTGTFWPYLAAMALCAAAFIARFKMPKPGGAALVVLALVGVGELALILLT